MELPDLTTAQTVQALAVAAVAVLTFVLGGFGKAWRFAVMVWTRVRGAGPALVLFENSLRGSYWGPATIAGEPGLQVVIHLDVSNVTDGPHRIMAARIAHWGQASNTFISVENVRSGMHAHDYPIPPHQVVPATISFIFKSRPPSREDKVIKVTVLLTNHQGTEYRLRVSLRGPKLK